MWISERLRNIHKEESQFPYLIYYGKKLRLYTHVINQIRFHRQVIINHKFALIKYNVNQFGWSWTDFEVSVSLINKQFLIGCRILKIWILICHPRGPSPPKTNFQIYFVFPPPTMLIKKPRCTIFVSIFLQKKSHLLHDHGNLIRIDHL